MKAAIIECYLKGLKNLPRSAEGVANLISQLTGEMGFSPLSDKEVKHLAEKFCRMPNKADRAKKSAKTGNEAGENI